MSARAGRTVETQSDWMRDNEKRMAHQEARPVPKEAADLMGPGLGPLAVQVQDWSADEAAFNGILFSQPGALNSPDGTKWWMGIVTANSDGYGLQTVRKIRDGVQPTVEYIREFATTGAGRTYGAWARTTVDDTGWVAVTPVAPFTTDAGALWVRRRNTEVTLRGYVYRGGVWAAGYITAFTLAAEFRPLADDYVAGGESPAAGTLIAANAIMLANGNFQIRTSAANTNGLVLGGMRWFTD